VLSQEYHVNRVTVSLSASAASIYQKLQIFLALLCIGLSVSTAFAQSTGKPARATRVAVSVVTSEVIADFAELQGRFVAGSTESVTAVVNAKIEILGLQLGDTVKIGQEIARQDSDDLVLRRRLLQAQLTEARVKREDLAAEIDSEIAFLDLAEQQADLLAGKAARAEGLVANNAIPIDTAETALNASLAARQKVLSQQSSIARKRAQLRLSAVTIERLQAEIQQLDADIAATTLRAQSDGQIIFIADYTRSYAREGEVIARILNPAVFEVEVEVPVGQLPFLNGVDAVAATTLDGQALTLQPRVVLPVQNARTGTRTVRLRVDGMPQEMVLADNAVVAVNVPITSPSPVLIIPKDAVIPINGGHIVYVAEAGKAVRKAIKLGAAVAAGFVVKSGLDAGVFVVTRGNEQLSDGKAIEYGDGKDETAPKGQQ
jgi:membrane fusion protein (multidrug efflux system)